MIKYFGVHIILILFSFSPPESESVEVSKVSLKKPQTECLNKKESKVILNTILQEVDMKKYSSRMEVVKGVLINEIDCYGLYYASFRGERVGGRWNRLVPFIVLPDTVLINTYCSTENPCSDTIKRWNDFQTLQECKTFASSVDSDEIWKRYQCGVQLYPQKIYRH